MSAPKKLYYSFGNHMHWVDMQWLWGYHVLPGSTRDMLDFCRCTGAKGNVNFDCVGYEKMAAEAPEALAELKAAISAGTIEPVGCSYGQPYGLFHGGESNIRQRVYGARTVLRLFGVRPKTFWEEEFDFFPQLPQMLAACGFEGASLYFQWTWHTPEIPHEQTPVIWWEGIDGTRLKTATRNRMNLHQWPEDFQALLDELARGEHERFGDRPLILQWLELMPSPDWMCRSELMIPKLEQLTEDTRFQVYFATLGEYLRETPDDVPVRRYGMHEVWHGMSLGKNGDEMRWESVSAESTILAAEALAAMASLLGRPYAQWDVYPVWELEEAWRELLQAQHHDNDECEGLCGRVGKVSYNRASNLAWHVYQLQLKRLAQTFGTEIAANLPPQITGSLVPSGLQHWKDDEESEQGFAIQDNLYRHDSKYTLEFDANVNQITEFSFNGRSLLEPERAFQTTMRLNGEIQTKRLQDYGNVSAKANGIHFDGISLWMTPHEELLHLLMHETLDITRPDPGMNAGKQMHFPVAFQVDRVYADTPYAVDEVQPLPIGLRKYPEGDWMTSPQWFEEVKNSIFASRFIDICSADGRGLLIDCGKPKCWFREGNDFRLLLSMYDPWDEDYFEPSIHIIRLIPHGPWTHKDRMMATRGPGVQPEIQLNSARQPERPLHPGQTWQPFKLDAKGSLLTALYRESEDFSGRDLQNYAGRGMGYPFVLRIVEFNGEPDECELAILGTVAQAYETNMMGETQDLIEPQVVDGKSVLRFSMRPREIKTLYLDIVEGRKVPRDLDAKRDIWATVHRVGEPEVPNS
jgi:alpha-mannosidase